MARTLGAALAATLILAGAAPASAATIYATTGTNLLTFNSENDDAPTVTPFTGIADEQDPPQPQQIVALDIRPEGSQLYGIARNDDGDDLFVIDPATGAGTRVNGSLHFAGDIGLNLGFDFNPRFPGTSRYVEGDRSTRTFYLDPGVTGFAFEMLDYDPAAGDPAVLGLAYTNSIAGATSTHGYVYDTATSPDQLATIASDGDGDRNNAVHPKLTAPVPIAGVDADPAGGFDVQPGTTAAFLALGDGTTWRLKSVDVTTGGLTDLREIASTVVYGIAVAPESTVRFPGATIQAPEGSTGTVTVQRTGATTGGADIQWQRVGGSATEGTDFTTSSGTIEFDSGEQSRPLDLGIVDDPAREGGETIELELHSPAGVALGTPFRTVVTIPISDQPAPAGNSGGTGGGDGGTPPPIVNPPLDPTPPGRLPTNAAPDTVKPVVTVSAPVLRARRARTRGVRLRVGANEPVALTVDLLLGTRRLVRRSLPLAAGMRTVTLRAKKKQRRKLRAGKVLRIRIAARDAAGNATTKTLRIRLRR